MTSHQKYFSLCLLMIVALLYGPSPALAQGLLGDAEGFALLAGDAVTCTSSTITGDVGVDDSTGAVTTTTCTVSGTVYAPGDPVAQAAYNDFLAAYTTLNNTACTPAPAGTLAGVTLTPGVYCVDTVAKTGTLTLNAQGDPNAQFIFLVGGALSATNFNVDLINGGDPCNIYWQTDAATTLTTSDVLGTILSGAAITITGGPGTTTGGLLATDAVTLTTGTTVAACETSGPPPPPDGNGNGKAKCNEGVGNGFEACDPGKGNNKDDGKPSNDEAGGTPGNPGRKQ